MQKVLNLNFLFLEHEGISWEGKFKLKYVLECLLMIINWCLFALIRKNLWFNCVGWLALSHSIMSFYFSSLNNFRWRISPKNFPIPRSLGSCLPLIEFISSDLHPKWKSFVANSNQSICHIFLNFLLKKFFFFSLNLKNFHFIWI